MSQEYTQTKFGRDATRAIYKGVSEVTEATAVTLGPLGRNVLIDYGYETTILHDGVSVASSINPEDPFMRNGARVIQEAAKKQRDAVGDGTTAVMILAQSVLDECLQMIASGINPMTLRRGLEAGAKKVEDALKEQSFPVTTLEEKKQIAIISAEDPTLGTLIAETIHKIGNDGVLTVEESKAQDTFVEYQEGMQIDRGYAHSFMVTDVERQIAVLEDVHVLVTDYPLTELATTGNFLEKVVLPNTKKVLFIAPEIGGDFLTAMLGAKIRGQFIGLGVRAPGIGAQMTEALQDICALTGATFISREAGYKFDELDFTVLGKLARVVSSKLSTIITGGAGHASDVSLRIQSIKRQIEEDDVTEYDRTQLQGRLAKLTQGVAVIKVAGFTEIEMKERKERAIDAICSLQSAVKHGAVLGGEVSYLHARSVLDSKVVTEKILLDALKMPFIRLTENAGYDGGEKLSDMKQQKKGYGLDVVTGEYVNLRKMGIIDSAMIPITAVRTAVSVAVQLMTLGACVVQCNQKDIGRGV